MEKSQQTAASTATPQDRKVFFLPKRANSGGWEKLLELGVVQTGESDYNFHKAEIPSAWDIRPTDVSPFQKRIYDAEGSAGKMIAKIFYKPGSAGGGGTLHVILSPDDPNAAE